MTLEILEASKAYGKQLALDKFSFTFGPGIYGILGPNGAGKSTLMGLLTDTVRRDGGTILWNGKEIRDLGRAYRSQLGYMAQSQGVYGHMTAVEYLHYVAQLKGIRYREASKQIGQLLETVHLEGDKNKKLQGFSGGMRQRVLLVQALLGDPKLVILDEPTAGLDPAERIRTRNYICQIAQNRIVLLATHLVPDIECIAQQVLLLHKGRLLRSDTPEALIASVSGKVGERLCTQEQALVLQKQYGLGNVLHRQEGQVLRLVGDRLPPDFTPVADHDLSLEEAYLYYIPQNV